MKKVITILLVLALLTGTCVLVSADGEAAFEYQLQLTNDAGETVSVNELNALPAGTRVHLNLHLERTDVGEGTYGIYGIEFQVRTNGLTYNNDGVCFHPGAEVTIAHYLSGDVVGFAYIDMDQRETLINNPEDIGQWTYTVSDTSSARMLIDVALVYVTGSFTPGVITTTYELKLNPSGGAIVGEDVSGVYPSGTVVTLPGAEREGYRFDGWSDGAEVFAADTDFTMNRNAVLTAQWTRLVTLTLDPNGGTLEGDTIISSEPGATVTLPTPVRDGYTFQGWSDGENVYPAGDYTVPGDVTLTAQWKLNEATDEPGPGPQPQRPYPDLQWVGPELNTADHFNYIIGYPDGTVHPTHNITRAEVATIFYRLMTKESREAYLAVINGFSDVEKADWFNVQVSTLSNAGILMGYPDGSFRPNANITRGELTAVITRFVKQFGGTAPFSDVDGHWAYDNIAMAAAKGWIKGYDDGTFRPNIQITRAETFAMVNRMLGRQPETKDDLHSGMITFPDNMNESAWYYLDVQEAANNHEYTRKTDGVHEKWTAKLEDLRW